MGKDEGGGAGGGGGVDETLCMYVKARSARGGCVGGGEGVLKVTTFATMLLEYDRVYC